MVNIGAPVATKSRVVFSWQDLDQRLPLVNRIMNDLVRTWNGVLAARARLELAECQPPGRSRDDETSELTEELNRSIDRINGYISEVETLGGMVQEFRRGIVNFPVQHEGRVVMACWRPEDTSVGAWHDLHETYSERKPAPRS